jgi:ribosomal-protein-alanine N-acetyltransferase
MRVNVRRPQPGDVRTLAEAEEICFPDPWPAQFFLSEILAPGRFNRLLVDSADRVTAYLFCAWRFLDLHVLKVATLPTFRRVGLASQLMEVAERHAGEVCGRSLTLEVRISNRGAIALYKTLGYRHIGRKDAYYGDGEAAVVMTKPVEDS